MLRVSMINISLDFEKKKRQAYEALFEVLDANFPAKMSYILLTFITLLATSQKGLNPPCLWS
jgi:hypothetical protein